MMTRQQLRSAIFNVTEPDFENLALNVYAYQVACNPVYRRYCKLLLKNDDPVTDMSKIPFLPIELFKSERIITGDDVPSLIFESSGTTGASTSKHYICDEPLYQESLLRCFKMFCGQLESRCILALLPSYLEREGSSLVYMTKELMKASSHPLNGFFLTDHQSLSTILMQAESHHEQTVLIGVSFALLDFAENHAIPLRNTLVMETGGMKGNRPELTRNELHAVLKEAFQVEKIWSEYGMTELLSQAYSDGDGIFRAPPWMKILIREEADPLELNGGCTSGAINIIDLANIDSCSFIATSDMGKLHTDGTFEVLGRMDMSDVRGCNLLAEQ